MRRLHPHHSSTLTALSETGSSVAHTLCHTPFRGGSLPLVVGRRHSHGEGGLLFRVGVGEQPEKSLTSIHGPFDRCRLLDSPMAKVELYDVG